VTRDPELSPIRQDEQLDLTRLEPWLRTHLPVGDTPLSIGQFGGGHANLTYLLTFGGTQYVLRRPPLGPIAPRSHDMAREYRVLSCLGAAFPLAPTSLALCTDAAIIGVDFHVMERRHGRVIRDELPLQLAVDRDAVHRLSEMIVDTLADLHGVDPAAVGLGELGRPQGFVTRQLSSWIARWHAAKDHDVQAANTLIAWLEREVPDADATALLHNDYKLDNLLLDARDPTIATAVLDWDMCTRGHPLMDLGYLLNVWVEAGDDPAERITTAMPSHHRGFLTRQDVVQRYANRSGFAVDEVRWFYAFGVFKLMVILQQIYIRYLRRQTQDPRFRDLGHRVNVLATKGRRVTTQATPV